VHSSFLSTVIGAWEGKLAFGSNC